METLVFHFPLWYWDGMIEKRGGGETRGDRRGEKQGIQKERERRKNREGKRKSK